VSQKSFNDLKIVLFILQHNSIIISHFVEITESIKIVLSCGSCFDYMIELSEELLNDSDYKQVLVLLQSERPALARQLSVEVVTCKLHW
jgi:Fe-S oxidoreductase